MHLHGGRPDGGHNHGTLGRGVVVGQLERFLRHLGHHGRGRPVAQDLLHHLQRVPGCRHTDLNACTLRTHAQRA